MGVSLVDCPDHDQVESTRVLAGNQIDVAMGARGAITSIPVDGIGHPGRLSLGERWYRDAQQQDRC
jgi:hypothetical protein